MQQPAHRITSVAGDRLDPLGDVRTTRSFPLGRLIPEELPCPTTCLDLRHTRRDQVVHPLLDVERDLPIDFPRDPVGAKDVENPVIPGHREHSRENCLRYAYRRTRSTPSVRRLQVACSSASCFFPRAVMA